MTEQLRRLSYISQSATDSGNGVPSHLASIVIRSRHYNHERHISGFLTYRDNLYFQVIEGRGDAVEVLMAKIMQDPRHQHITVIWDDANQARRLFTGWKLKLSSSSATCEEVGEFLRANQSRLDALEPELLSKLRRIFQLDLILTSRQGNMPTEEEFEDSQFRLQALPSAFSLIDEKPQAIEIFSALLSDWATPRELSEQFGEPREELYRLLTNPRVKPLLLRRGPEFGKNTAALDGPATGKPHSKSFYQSLRSFFLATRQ